MAETSGAMALAIMLSAATNYVSNPLQPWGAHALRHCYDGGNTGKAWWRMSRKKRASSIQCDKLAQDGCFSEDGNGNGSGKRVFVFGLGFTTLELATALQRQGWQVSGTCRSEEKRAALELRGLKAHLFDSEGEVECLEGEAMQDLLSSSHLVSSIPPGGFSCADPVLANLKSEVLQSHALRWIGYLSSTSVYGDWQGDWVSEDTEPQPVERRAISRWEAEKEWLQFGQEAGICTRVFRLGGIYGPGRSALDTILRGEKLSDRQQRRGRKRFTARIHVADICQVIIKAMDMSQGEWPTRVYNVVDDDPTPRADVMAYAHTLLQTAKNVEGEGSCASEDDDASSVKREGITSRRVAEKRVSNKRVKEELQVQLLYPSFRSGLRAITGGSSNASD